MPVSQDRECGITRAHQDIAAAQDRHNARACALFLPLPLTLTCQDGKGTCELIVITCFSQACGNWITEAYSVLTRSHKLCCLLAQVYLITQCFGNCLYFQLSDTWWNIFVFYVSGSSWNWSQNTRCL